MTTNFPRRLTPLRNLRLKIEILVEEKIHTVDIGVQNAARARKRKCLPCPALQGVPRRRVAKYLLYHRYLYRLPFSTIPAGLPLSRSVVFQDRCVASREGLHLDRKWVFVQLAKNDLHTLCVPGRRNTVAEYPLSRSS